MMILRLICTGFGNAAAICLAALCMPQVLHAQGAEGGAEESQTVILIAAPNLVDANYRRAVVVVTPTEGDRHIGVIVNRPTRRSLASLFPEHAPSKAVVEPVYFGGPMSRTALFAVARGEQEPQAGVIPLMKNLYLALTVTIVDDVIHQTPNEARYYVGNVQWRAGELKDELKRGVWNVLNADPEVILTKDPEHLWERLSRMARAVMARCENPVRAHLIAVKRIAPDLV